MSTAERATSARRFDDLSDGAARDVLLDCFPASGPWIERVLSQRPFVTSEALFAAVGAEIRQADAACVDVAASAHPRIGEPPRGRGRAAGWSRAEQFAVHDAEAPVRAALDAAVREYEHRFGRTFLIAAHGKAAAEILAEVTQRLEASPEAELQEVRVQLNRIARLRLEGWLAT